MSKVLLLNTGVVKKRNKMNWINSWKKGNKKEKYEITIRLGRLTILEMQACLFCDTDTCCTKKLRIIVLNFGFEM